LVKLSSKVLYTSTSFGPGAYRFHLYTTDHYLAQEISHSSFAVTCNNM